MGVGRDQRQGGSAHPTEAEAVFKCSGLAVQPAQLTSPCDCNRFRCSCATWYLGLRALQFKLGAASKSTVCEASPQTACAGGERAACLGRLGRAASPPSRTSLPYKVRNPQL